jgi:hypothetical protein
LTDVLAISRLSWRKCYRIIPSRFPPVNLFDRIAPEKDSQILGEVETFTNDRVRQEIGEVQHVRPEDVVGGKGASYIMAPFTHPDPCGDRFSDGSYGVLYGAARNFCATRTKLRCRYRCGCFSWTSRECFTIFAAPPRTIMVILPN